MRTLSAVIRRALGRWWLCLAFFATALVLFGVVVPHGVAVVTHHRTLAPQILDEYVMTWTPADARHFYAALGAGGRAAYRTFYLELDFWFPVLTLTLAYASLLSLAFPAGRRFAWLNLTPIAMYALDAAENVNHFVMAGAYPALPALAVGPAFTWGKWVCIDGLPVVALAGFAAQWRRRRAHQSGRASPDVAVPDGAR